MKLIYIIIIISIGIIMSLYSENLIKLFKEDKYVDHKSNKYGKVITGIWIVILGLWMLYEYLFK